MPSGPHVHEETFRIAMSDVDVAQIHFTAFYRWMDRSLCAWLAEIGYPFTRLLEEGPGVPIVESRCGFHLRVMLDDFITIRTVIGRLGRTSFRSRHRFLRDGELAAEGELVHVCVNRQTRDPVPIPEWLRARAQPDGA